MYLQVTPLPLQVSTQNMVFSLGIDDEEGTTGIKFINLDGAPADFPTSVYSLDGRLINNTASTVIAASEKLGIIDPTLPGEDA